MLDVRMFTVGPVQENCFFVRLPDAETALVIDPGDEVDRLLAAKEALGIQTIAAILITHTHFDHIGAVKPLHDATGAPVYCPALERDVLADINAHIPPSLPFGPFESCEADHTVAGGDVLELAELTIDVRFTPGHSPGHVTYSVRGEDVLLSGDVLFQNSVGRVDLPGADWPTLRASIASLVDEFPAATVVYPGHMGITTLGTELANNPFLRELSA